MNATAAEQPDHHGPSDPEIVVTQAFAGAPPVGLGRLREDLDVLAAQDVLRDE